MQDRHKDPPGIDVDAVAQMLAASLADGLDQSRVRARLIAGGLSNLTYELDDGARTWILRRPPLGQALPSAHDMAREYRVLSALAQHTDLPVPRPALLCTDVAITGAPFYVMERIEGRTLDAPEDVDGFDSATAARCAHAVIDVLARLHAVDPSAVGLADFGRPAGFLERQLRRWRAQWERSKQRDVPALEELAHRLERALPRATGHGTIVHGDYRLGNLLFVAHQPDHVAALLDWEMATIGDPLTDLGFLLSYWDDARGPVFSGRRTHERSLGFPTHAQLADHYAQRSGRDLDDLDFYVLLARYKDAVITEGLYTRSLSGETISETHVAMGRRVPELAENALVMASQSSLDALRGT